MTKIVTSAIVLSYTNEDVLTPIYFDVRVNSTVALDILNHAVANLDTTL